MIETIKMVRFAFYCLGSRIMAVIVDKLTVSALSIFIVGVACSAQGQTNIFYIKETASGIVHDHPTAPDLSACIGSIADNLSDLLGQCHSKAPDGHIENRTYAVYNRIWNKRSIDKGSAGGGFLQIPYHLIKIKDGSHSTYYNHWVSYSTKTCTNEGCYVIAVGADSIPFYQCVGNPIEVSGGRKVQKETDIDGPISFERFYLQASGGGVMGGPWHHSFNKSLKLITSQPSNTKPLSIVSEPYDTKVKACIDGWADIKNRLDASWAPISSPEYSSSDDICRIRSEGDIVAEIPLVNTKDLLARITNVVQLHREDGSILNFEEGLSGGWKSIEGHPGQLERTADGGWQYISNKGIIESYSSVGLLMQVRYPQGEVLTLNYDIKRELQRVTSNKNNIMFFEFENKLLSGVTINNDLNVKFIYDDAGMLKSVSYSDNTQRIYHYEDSRFPTYLTGITDERGVRYATWTYDAQGRAISSEHAGGTDKTLLAFNADGSTTVTNPLGKQTTYHFDDIAGARRVTQVEGHATASCEGVNQNYTYTPEGWLASKTDWKGNITTYSYNTSGQEISRTEAFGTPGARTITTEWHPDLYVKTRVVEGGKETLYTYDDNGRLLSTTTNPLPIQ